MQCPGKVEKRVVKDVKYTGLERSRLRGLDKKRSLNLNMHRIIFGAIPNGRAWVSSLQYSPKRFG